MITIEDLTPQLDAGRFPVKRVEGDTVEVGADIYKDGHDLLAARIAYRAPKDRAWRYAPMSYDYNSDRWTGRFVLDSVGRWVFTVEAWTDAFASWQAELRKRIEAGTDVGAELIEGAALLSAPVRRQKGDRAKALRFYQNRLRDERSSVEDRREAALSPELTELVAGYLDRDALTPADRTLTITVDRKRARFAAWYEMFPRSQGAKPGRHGTFADARRRLPDLAAMGFDVIYLPPIHPIGRTNRKGPNNALTAGPHDPGSPWAIGSEAGGHDAVEPKLGTIKDFDRFVAEARKLGMEVALDYALQCSPDHPWAKQHPEWFFVRQDGTIRYAENPPKKYEDIYPLNMWCADRDGLWKACRDVLLFWIDHGVRTFRVDNPHTKPFAFWAWVIAEIQKDHPDVIVLAEAFTRPKRMRQLAKLGFTQSYTYFTWRNTASELRSYLTELTTTEMKEYFRGNFFANTPDILHAFLQEGGRSAFQIRLLLAATLSPLYGLYSGFELCENVAKAPGSEEYVDSEKYQVRVRDWDAPGNIREDITTINRIRRENPALQRLANLWFHTSEYDGILFYRKSVPGNHLLIAVNLDPRRMHETNLHVPVRELGIGDDEPFVVTDLLTGDAYTWRGSRNYVRLDPARQVGHIFRVESA